ncbi:MAG TPA: hypothetical protein VLE02_02120 [Nitrosarchaeum sp.]|nr:hypothetical protein [Nitrosarchaeum sp.]
MNYRKVYPFNSTPLAVKTPLTCGTQKINIVGAWIEVMDPFGECSNTPSSILKNSCGNFDPLNAKSCTSSDTCGLGMTCENGKCAPQKCTQPLPPNTRVCPTDLGKFCNADNQCGSDDLMCKMGYCVLKNDTVNCFKCEGNGRYAQYPLCSNLNSSYQNTMCNSSAITNNCKIRDASAYLSMKCNGKSECDINSWNPNSSEYFGPLPCNIKPSDDLYGFLPIVPGWGGGPPMGTSKNIPGSVSKGYYVHGLYTCTD